MFKLPSWLDRDVPETTDDVGDDEDPFYGMPDVEDNFIDDLPLDIRDRAAQIIDLE